MSLPLIYGLRTPPFPRPAKTVHAHVPCPAPAQAFTMESTSMVSMGLWGPGPVWLNPGSLTPLPT